ncbi:Multiple antibiotic resistance protein marR [Actinoplanes sp. SE50]|uniref:MarR family winged helix-turn-helix transcriptional regulator n=1 Tax=unclassified Actinoplanes TaxID=2626549 RepID=UPI00023EBEC1|nr:MULTISPECIES: MarR family winged helix-turn-helix transcriptional regulator [unclassified Actinoplanes]AEV82943.1 Multiple antibiotic resistance protein marR [Actinoplanes sp. SE50/110]ATO81339.1 Multiple antibiotic resistance protein marR [Actinoplanes sp. SE50]SLL98746.1 MarR family transcriptional regulator [Actinoplanes sp. SE50/110]
MRLPRLIFLLFNADRAVRRWIDARSADTGIGASGAGVLFYLAGHENALIGDVTAALGASPSGMSGLVNRLERSGCVSRSPDPADARAVRLTLTPRGRESVTRARDLVDDLNQQLTAGFDEAEVAVIERWLEHVSRRDFR